MKTPIRLISCIGVRYDLAMLPHFLKHYLALGIAPENMHIILNGQDKDKSAFKEAQSILDEHGISPEQLWVAPYTSGSMWEKRREVQQRVADKNDWVISADVDELQEYPADLTDFLAYCEKRDVNCVQGVFIDRLAARGQLRHIAPNQSIWEQFPVESDVICTIRKGEEGSYWYGTVNLMACKGNVLPDRGGHSPISNGTPINYLFARQLATFPRITDPSFRFALPVKVHHFKWVDTMATSVSDRLETPGASKPGSRYGEKVLAYIEKEDRIPLQDVPVHASDLFSRLPWRLRIALLRSYHHSNQFKKKVKYKISSWIR